MFPVSMSMDNDIKWLELKPPERRRVYHFHGGGSVTFEEVVRIELSPNGMHRRETAKGRKAFVAPGWEWLEVDTASWSV